MNRDMVLKSVERLEKLANDYGVPMSPLLRQVIANEALILKMAAGGLK